MTGFECVFQLLTCHYLFTLEYVRMVEQQREAILGVLIAAICVARGHIHNTPRAE